jgi:Holliday junction resolvasome RuvABC endonuclease subunit
MGVKSAFTFGNGFGHLEMALTAAGIPFERVSPQRWQKALGCLTKGDKNVSKRRAQELFPSMKITHATADALLIAYYGTKQ